MKDAWITRTHARLRLAQGDVKGAKLILESLLKTQPDDPEARRMLRELTPKQQIQHREESFDDLPPPVSGDIQTVKEMLKAKAQHPQDSIEFQRELLKGWLSIDISTEEKTMEDLLVQLQEQIVPEGTALVIDDDGLVVSSCGDETGEEAIAVFAAESARMARKAARTASWGPVHEQSVETQTWRMLWVSLGAGLGLILSGPISPVSPLGRWRHAAHLTARELSSQLV